MLEDDESEITFDDPGSEITFDDSGSEITSDDSGSESTFDVESEKPQDLSGLSGFEEVEFDEETLAYPETI